MPTLSILGANLAIYLVLAVALAVWVTSDRGARTGMLVAGLITVAVLGLVILAAGALWTDPRPFTVDGVAPLVPHPADNGFPSDHAALAAAVAGVVLAWRRRIGLLLIVVAVVIAASRVSVHVHHVPDVVGGLVIGLAAAAAGVRVGRAASDRWRVRRSSGDGQASIARADAALES